MDNQRKVIALGFFDGVHLGHGALLRRVAERARELDAVPCAFTFDRSPAAALTGKTVPLLSGVNDRRNLMEALYGIQEVIVAPFDVMRQMDWRDFVAQYLQKELGVVHVVAGHDFHFGYKGEGTPRRLGAKCAELGIGCDIIPKVELDGITVSSTYIRMRVAAGDMEGAARFLGHPHVLSGEVVHGSELGRTLGTPTANLLVPEGVIAPAFGVYATRAVLPEGTYLAVTNVGVRPTVNEDKTAVTVEPWILDYHGDLYGQDIRVEFYTRLRPERKFPSVQALRDAILENARQTREYFTKTQN
ncbi:MAG: riboflavin biosynthesis protein RibF [Oscillospiraceae bacterium]|nr:riboflavin biosynthesis protein RibF [Oscillospiraceae bacterium]